jgi:hypothetical protein
VLSAILFAAVAATDVLDPRGRPLADYRLEDRFAMALMAALICLYLDLWRRLSKQVSKGRLRYAITLGVAGLILGLPQLELTFPLKFLVDGLFVLTQIALIGNALKGYSQAGASEGRPAPPVTAEPLAGEEAKSTLGVAVTAKSPNRRWLWAVRIAAVLSPMILSAWAFIFSVGFARTLIRPELLSHGYGDIRFLVWPFMVVVALPYLHILWRLAGSKYKKGLALVVTWGSAAFLISLVLLALAFTASAGSMMLCAGLFMLSQGLLVRFAIRAYYLIGRAPGDVGILVMSLIPTALYLLLLSVLVLFGIIILFPTQM